LSGPRQQPADRAGGRGRSFDHGFTIGAGGAVMNGKSGFDTVVFDLVGVLIDWDPRYLYRRLFDDEVAMEHFLAEICTPLWNHQQDAGRSWHEAVTTLSAQYPQH